MYELLKKLTQAYGPSANEKSVASIIEEEIKPYVDEVKKDAMGNLIAVKKGGSKKILLSAPMDECCFLSTHIEDNGYIRFSVLSPIDALDIVNSNVVYENGIMGVIKPEDSKSDMKLQNLYINVGAKNVEDANKKLPLGTCAVLKGEYYESDLTVMSPALAGRAACMCLIDVIKNLPEKLEADMHFLFSVQNKLGARGSKVAAQCINPDIAVSIDAACCSAHDYSGKGPVLKLRNKSMVSTPDLIKCFRSIADKCELPLQEQVAVNDISDVDGVIEAGIDAEVISIALPVKNYQSSSEIVYKSDIENLKKLIANFICCGN